MQAVDRLLQAEPSVEPPADFVARTVARLPDVRVRLWWSSVAFMLLLFSGLLPLGGIVWAYVQYGGALVDASAAGIAWQTVRDLIQIVEVGALSFGVALRDAVTGQPFVVGWLVLLAGIVWTWRSVYRQFMQDDGLPAAKLAPARANGVAEE
jgi:hypothetical protein